MTDPSAPISVAVVDDDWENRWAVRLLGTAHADRIRVVQEAESVEELLAPDAPHAEVVLLDVYLGEDDELSIAYIPRLVERGSTVLLHTKERAPAKLIEAMDLGASGLVLKKEGPEVLLAAIVGAAAGEVTISSPLANALLYDSRCARLTPRQVEVIQLIADGLSEKEAAVELTVSPGAVKKHMKDIAGRFAEQGRPAGGKKTVREAIGQGHIRPRLPVDSTTKEAP